MSTLASDRAFRLAIQLVAVLSSSCAASHRPVVRIHATGTDNVRWECEQAGLAFCCDERRVERETGLREQEVVLGAIQAGGPHHWVVPGDWERAPIVVDPSVRLPTYGSPRFFRVPSIEVEAHGNGVRLVYLGTVRDQTSGRKGQVLELEVKGRSNASTLPKHYIGYLCVVEDRKRAGRKTNDNKSRSYQILRLAEGMD